MESVYSFVDAIKEIPEKVEVLQGVITSIFDWTIECANFIGTYIDHNFGGVAFGRLNPSTLTLTGQFFRENCQWQPIG